MSNVQNLPDADPTHINELYELLEKLSKGQRPFGLEINFDGKCFSTSGIKINNLKASEINLNPIEKRIAPVPDVPTVRKFIHRNK